MKQTFISKNENDTMLIAKKLAEKFTGGEVIALNGDLGAGKTVFVKGLAKGLKITELITSPTFTILNCYKGRLELFHFDMYRIDEVSEASEIGVKEHFESGGVCVVEWAEKIEELLPEDLIRIDITKAGENIREITIDENISN